MHVSIKCTKWLSHTSHESFGVKLRPCSNNNLPHSLTHSKHPVPGDVVDHERPCSSAVVGAGDGPEALLSRCVPNLQLYLLAAHLDYPCTKLHANRMGAVRHDWGEEERLLWIQFDWFYFCYFISSMFIYVCFCVATCISVIIICCHVSI